MTEIEFLRRIGFGKKIYINKDDVYIAPLWSTLFLPIDLKNWYRRIKERLILKIYSTNIAYLHKINFYNIAGWKVNSRSNETHIALNQHKLNYQYLHMNYSLLEINISLRVDTILPYNIFVFTCLVVWLYEVFDCRFW